MPVDKPIIFPIGVTDIADQLARLSDHRKALLGAETIMALVNVLNGVQQCMDGLALSVSNLRYRALRAPPEADASTDPDGTLIRALLKSRGLG